jgi:hypothetical protein
MSEQKFNKGDYVQVAKDLGPSMAHFASDCEAIVIGSYADKYGGGNTSSYTIHIKDRGEISWYYESQLELITPDKLDLLEEWEVKKQEESDKKSDLDWIFTHGDEVLDNPHGASIQTLANCFGLMNLWGSRGEGVTYFSNSRRTLDLASPWLKKNDKQGWLNFCDTIKPSGSDIPESEAKNGD